MQDLRLALRLLGKAKTFAVTAALTLAICIGVNVVLFAVVDHVLLSPLRVPNSNRVRGPTPGTVISRRVRSSSRAPLLTWLSNSAICTFSGARSASAGAI
jgi:Na+-translocating ferredoxin:NAD+ oxidoreductase RnfE subunit